MSVREQESHKSAQISQPFAVALVSAYLFMVGLWLLTTGRIRLPSLGRVLLSRMRPPYRGELQKANVRQDQGVAFVASVPACILSDKEAASALLLYEDGKVLG